MSEHATEQVNGQAMGLEALQRAMAAARQILFDHSALRRQI